MKWTLRMAEQFVRLNAKGCEGKYRYHADELAEKIGCTKASIQSMRRKAIRLVRLGMIPEGPTFALYLLAPEQYLQTHRLADIGYYAHRELTPVRQFVRRARLTGKPHLVGPYKRNISVTSAEARP